MYQGGGVVPCRYWGGYTTRKELNNINNVVVCLLKYIDKFFGSVSIIQWVIFMFFLIHPTVVISRWGSTKVAFNKLSVSTCSQKTLLKFIYRKITTCTASPRRRGEKLRICNIMRNDKNDKNRNVTLGNAKCPLLVNISAPRQPLTY